MVKYQRCASQQQLNYEALRQQSVINPQVVAEEIAELKRQILQKDNCIAALLETKELAAARANAKVSDCIGDLDLLKD